MKLILLLLAVVLGPASADPLGEKCKGKAGICQALKDSKKKYDKTFSSNFGSICTDTKLKEKGCSSYCAAKAAAMVTGESVECGKVTRADDFEVSEEGCKQFEAQETESTGEDGPKQVEFAQYCLTLRTASKVAEAKAKRKQAITDATAGRDSVHDIAAKFGGRLRFKNAFRGGRKS